MYCVDFFFFFHTSYCVTQGLTSMYLCVYVCLCIHVLCCVVCVIVFVSTRHLLTCIFKIRPCKTPDCGGFIVSRMCYQKNDLWWTDNHSTGNWNCTKSLQHKSRENAAGNKCNWIPVCRTCVCMCVCVCFVCMCVLLCMCVCNWRANRERASYTRSRSGSPQKSHLLTMYCCDTHICTNVKSWKQLSIWLLVILDLVFFGQWSYIL